MGCRRPPVRRGTVRGPSGDTEASSPDTPRPPPPTVCNTTTCPQSPPRCRPGEELIRTQKEGDCCPTFICRECGWELGTAGGLEPFLPRGRAGAQAPFPSRASAVLLQPNRLWGKGSAAGWLSGTGGRGGGSRRGSATGDLHPHLHGPAPPAPSSGTVEKRVGAPGPFEPRGDTGTALYIERLVDCWLPLRS